MQAERPVAVHDHHGTLGLGQLGRHRVAGADPERSEWTRIEPVPLLVDSHHGGRSGDEIAAVADDDRVLSERVGDLLAGA